jgi:hypothetical protein
VKNLYTEIKKEKASLISAESFVMTEDVSIGGNGIRFVI